ncbi:glycoside hydrolase family 5 protein [Niabella terrae]
MSFTILSVSAQERSVDIHGALQVAGARLLDQQGTPLRLKGMSFGWSCFHPRFYTAGAVKELKEQWHCNVVRAALGVEPEGGYLKNKEAAWQQMITVIDAAIQEGIYVIVDWHSHNIQLEAALEFFTKIASRYKDQPHIIYEIFNEPDEETWAEVKAYSEKLISAIRAIDPDNIILVGTPHWSQDLHLAAADPIRGQENLMYTLHFYAATHKKALRDHAGAAIAAGLPVFVSESAGMEATGDGPIDQQEWEAYIDWMREHNLSWVTWSVSDKDETCSVLNPSAASEGGWKPGDIKRSGKMVQEYLKDY